MFKKKSLVFILVIVLIICMFAGCASTKGMTESEISAEKDIVRMGVLKGPSSLGMLGIMQDNEAGSTLNSYDFTIAGSPQDIQAKFINGELDIVAVPTNLAAALYNKTENNISVIAVGTLGVLYVLTSDDNIASFKDLAGKTVYASGQGSTPEYILDYLIEKNNLKGTVTVEYKAEHSEVAALIASGNAEVVMLPQPFVTTVISKDPNIKVALDLNDEWRKAADNTELTMTCVIVRNEFLKENKTTVDKFLEEYKASTEFVNTNVSEAASLSEKFDIIPKDVAEKAIPKCGIVFIAGNDIKKSVNPLLEVLFAANPQSVGGKVPDDEFYYKG